MASPISPFSPQTSQRLSLQLKSLIRPSHPLLLTNIHDPPTASLALSFPQTLALATASFAIAASSGVPDEDLDLPTNLAAIARIRAQIVRENKHELVPLTVDLQDGYGESLGEAVESVVRLGAVGCNLEDSRTGSVDGSGKARTELLSAEEHAERVKIALETAASLGVRDFVVNARTDCVKLGGTVEEAVRRGRIYLDAGATSVFVWGGVERGLRDAEVKTLVQGLDGRLNVIYKKGSAGGLSVKELGDMGVARISMGPLLWREGMAAIRGEMERILKSA